MFVNFPLHTHPTNRFATKRDWAWMSSRVTIAAKSPTNRWDLGARLSVVEEGVRRSVGREAGSSWESSAQRR